MDEQKRRRRITRLELLLARAASLVAPELQGGNLEEVYSLGRMLDARLRALQNGMGKTYSPPTPEQTDEWMRVVFPHPRPRLTPEQERLRREGQLHAIDLHLRTTQSGEHHDQPTLSIAALSRFLLDMGYPHKMASQRALNARLQRMKAEGFVQALPGKGASGKRRGRPRKYT
jgi:hypothetical protein